MRKRHFISLAVAVIFGISCVIVSKVAVGYYGSHEGLFLIKGENGSWLEVTDDLFSEDAERFIYGFPLSLFKHVVSDEKHTLDHPGINFEWNESTGRGFIKNIYPDGRKLLFCLSRFRDSLGLHSSGLFLGGDLPPGNPDFQMFNHNETGVAYFDGKRYYHIWCNANEGISDGANKPISPSQWQFIDSKVLESSSKDLTIISRHRTLVNGVPVTIERFLFYTVDNTYITLVTKIANVGSADTTLTYVYGDEPWLGNFGSSSGNIGWIKGRLITTEMKIDTKRYDYAGMFDYGNILAGEAHNFTNKANFIEWKQTNRPTLAYFSNDFGKIGRPEEKTPLASLNNRVIVLQWGKYIIKPGGTLSFTLAIGMAGTNPQTGFPVKPDTGLN